LQLGIISHLKRTKKKKQRRQPILKQKKVRVKVQREKAMEKNAQKKQPKKPEKLPRKQRRKEKGMKKLKKRNSRGKTNLKRISMIPGFKGNTKLMKSCIGLC
jgi:hypothetical protein